MHMNAEMSSKVLRSQMIHNQASEKRVNIMVLNLELSVRQSTSNEAGQQGLSSDRKGSKQTSRAERSSPCVFHLCKMTDGTKYFSICSHVHVIRRSACISFCCLPLLTCIFKSIYHNGSTSFEQN